MNRLHTLGLVLVALSVAGLVAAAEDLSFPVIDGREALAVVNGEPITVDAFFRDLVALHDNVDSAGATRTSQQPRELLERIIEVRLVLQEARNIGLDETDEHRAAVAAFRRDEKKRLLYRKKAETIGDVDAALLEQRYRDTVREVEVHSLLFGTRDDGVAFMARIAEGDEFPELSDEWVAAGRAEAGDVADSLPVSRLLPAVRDAVATMKPGEISPLVEIGAGQFAVLQLLEVRYPADDETRKRIKQELLQRERSVALIEYADGLKNKHARIDDALLESLDFEAAEPGLEALLDDERLLAEVEGQEPVRVADLARAIKKEFFHGVEAVIGSGKLNARKVPLLDRQLVSRAVMREADLQGLGDSGEYAAMVEEYENSLLFEAFLRRVVEPQIRINDEELQAYRQRHLAEFSSPEMLRVESLAFAVRDDAEQVLRTLNSGADFEWTRAHADGRMDPSDPDLLRFPPSLVVREALPDDVRRVLADAQRGEYRLYAPEEGPSYVLHVRALVPATPEPFDRVRKTLTGRVYGEKRDAAFGDWVGKLRAASEVEIFASTEQLRRMLGKKMNG